MLPITKRKLEWLYQYQTNRFQNKENHQDKEGHFKMIKGQYINTSRGHNNSKSLCTNKRGSNYTKQKLIELK